MTMSNFSAGCGEPVKWMKGGGVEGGFGVVTCETGVGTLFCRTWLQEATPTPLMDRAWPPSTHDPERCAGLTP